MIDFEELDYRQTPMGELVLRRRGEPRLEGREVYEVKLGDDFLMSSLFSEGEIALTELGLKALEKSADVSVVVGGLGLGYTAVAALENTAVTSMLVVETMAEVIDWHQRGLVPLGRGLSDDPRTRYVNGDFFAMNAGDGFDPDSPDRRFDAILLDIDHSPQHVLHPSHVGFYDEAGLTRLRSRLFEGGVFSLWSNDPPDAAWQGVASQVFKNLEAHVVSFDNPFMGGQSTNTVYVGRA